MKREAKIMRNEAMESLILAIEIFNRPSDLARTSATLILIDHSFEMLLKACIVHRGGRIRERLGTGTIGFDACVRKALTDGVIKFIADEQALALQILNGLRDAAQHYIIDISEPQLYIHIQSGVTLFRDILRLVFSQELASVMARRVLPVSLTPPVSIETLFDSQVDEIKQLLFPGRRRRDVAYAKLRPLAILEASVQGKKSQPSESELARLATMVKGAQSWAEVFPGVSSITFSIDGVGPAVQLRLVKKAGIPIEMVKEGTPGTSVVAVRRVNELGFYSLSYAELANEVRLSKPKTLAMVRYLGIEEDPQYFLLHKVGKSQFKRYSPLSVKRIVEAYDQLTDVEFAEVWRQYGPVHRKRLA